MSAETSAKYERLSIRIEPPLARVLLSHPPLNVIDLRMMDELRAALCEIDLQPAVSMIVLRGEGRSFSAGVDVAAHAPESVKSMLEKFHAAIRALITNQKITIAAVHGNCFGGGAELAMVCDLVYTAEDSQWGFPEIQLGCFPPVAATGLASLVGQKCASELILTGRTISGTEAAEIGLATRAVAPDQLDGAINEAAHRLSKLSSAALALAKKANYAWEAMHFEKGLARAEKIYLEELIRTEDAQEGIRAFLEKRTPEWRGR